MDFLAQQFREDHELMSLLWECSESTKVTSKVFFPERFSAPFSQLHDQIFEAIDGPARKVVIAAPRGIGKTSIALSHAAKRMLFRDSRFIVYVSNSATNATLQTENLKAELASGEFIKKVFGPLKTKSGELFDESFSKASWATDYGTLVLPRGSGQQVRGLLYRTSRPDLFIIDDLEDTETITNEEIRRRREQWFFGDLMKAVSRVSDNWKIIYIDTVKHEDSLLLKLLDSSDWLPLKLSLCDEDGNSNAPEFVSSETIKKEKQEYREKGLLDVFYREYMNESISKEDAVFKDEYFKYYSERTLKDKHKLENVVIVDPAKTVKVHSAESAIVGIGLDMDSNKIYVRDIVHRKLHPDEIYEEMFLMADRLKARVVGVEVTSLNEFITQPLKNEMFRRGKFFQLVELKARAKKEDRIAQLVPYYRQGFVYHNEDCCGVLEAQLLTFPRSRLWDVMDAFAYIIELLDLGDRFFTPPEETNLEDEYKELEDEGFHELPLGKWRVI